MAAAVGARLSTTSEGLWLTAALTRVTRLPATLKVRPIGGLEGLSAHPGLAELESAGVCHGGVLDPDVADWVMTLGRPDIELDLTINAGVQASGRAAVPPPMLHVPDDPIEAYAALTEWNNRQPPQRVAVLCRREGRWVSAARMWQPGAGVDGPTPEDLDEIVVSPLGSDRSVTAAVHDLLGSAVPAQFAGASIESDVLDSIVSHWQSNPDTNVVAMLVDAGLSPEQARVVEAVGDVSTTRASIAALEHRIEGPSVARLAVMIADTAVGRVLVSSSSGPDGRLWTMLTAGTEQRIGAALTELLESLPSGTQWVQHRRVS
jgi:hypothetical protein